MVGSSYAANVVQWTKKMPSILNSTLISQVFRQLYLSGKRGKHFIEQFFYFKSLLNFQTDDIAWASQILEVSLSPGSVEVGRDSEEKEMTKNFLLK